MQENVSFFSNKNIYTITEENFKHAIINRPKGYLDYIVQKVIKKRNLKHLIEDNFIFILNESNYEELLFLLTINYNFDYVKMINDNILNILENFSIEKLVELNLSIELSQKNKKLLNQKLSENKKEFLSALFNLDPTINEDDKENLLFVLEKLVDELITNEKVNLVDIKKVSGGNYSKVAIIGDKVLKVGSERMRFNIPYNEHILVPIIRKDLSIISDISMLIEVSEKVDTNFHLTDDELYQIYKDLRINGIIWTDVKNDNLGRLLKDNIVHYDNVLLDNEAKGIEGTSTKTLKKGEYVIIDTDFIYDEDDENIKWGNMKSMMFETRYVNELNNKENIHKM